MPGFTQIPNSQGYIDSLANEDLFGNVSFGMGRGGKIARSALKQFQAGGDIGQNDFFKYKLNQMKAVKGQTDRARNEGIKGNLAFSSQPGLTAGIQAESQNEADQQFQTGVAGAAGDSFQSALDEYFRSRGAKNQVGLTAAQIELERKKAAAAANTGSYDRDKPGFFGQLGQGVATGVGQLIGGAGKLL